MKCKKSINKNEGKDDNSYLDYTVCQMHVYNPQNPHHGLSMIFHVFTDEQNIGRIKVDYKYIISYQEGIIFHKPKFYANGFWLSNGYLHIVQAPWKVNVNK